MLKKIFLIAIAILTVSFVAYINYPKSGSFNNLVLKKYSDKRVRDITILRSIEPTNSYFKDTHKINSFLDYISKFSLVENRHYLERTPNINYDKNCDFLISYTDSSVLGIEIWNNEYIEIYLKLPGKQTKSEKYKIANNDFDVDFAYNLFKD